MYESFLHASKLPRIALFTSDLAWRPLEPPPDGDVELHEARKILRTETVLIGNIEERLFEIGRKTDIEKQVKKTISQAAITVGFILCPTAMPISTPLRKRIQ